MRDETLLKKDTESLYKLAWKYWSEYIRARDGYICFTCNRKKEKSELQAGHYSHGGTFKMPFWCDFNEININTQCQYCNNYKNGELGVYAEKLIKRHGIEVVEELKLLKYSKKPWGNEDLVNIIKNCKKYLQNKYHGL